MALITRKTTKVLGVLGLVVIVAGSAVGLGVPTVNNILLQTEEIKTTEDALTTLQTNRNALLVTQANHANVSSFADSMLSQFPELAGTPELLTAMQQAAGVAGITPSQIPVMTLQAPEVRTPEVPAAAPVEEPAAAEGETPAETPETPAGAETVDTSISSNTYARVPIEVSIMGSARQLEAFMDEIHSLDRAIVITGFTVVNNDDENLPPGTKTLSFVGSTYVYSKIQTPNEQAAAAAAETGTPEGTVPAETPAP